MYWHKDLYRIDISEAEFHSKLKMLIGIREENSIKNHIDLFQYRGSDESVRGKLSKSEFTLWRTNRSFNGIFYPIFIGRIFKINNINLVEIRTRFNPVAEFMELIFIAATSYLIFLGFGFHRYNPLISLPTRIILGIIMFFIFQFVPLSSYYSMKNQTLKGLKEYLGLTKVTLNKKSRH